MFHKEEIKYIADNTTIKNIILSSPGTFNNIKCQEDFYVIDGRSITIYAPDYTDESISSVEALLEKLVIILIIFVV